MTEILREPGRVANGLSTITARLTAENDDYIASITGGMGVIDKNTGELRSTFDILQDLSKAWEHLTSVEKQELAETVAGKTQRSLFTAIMQNFDSAVGATEAALNSENSAAKENEKRMDSLQGKVQQLESAWQSFSRDTLDSGVIKSLLTLGTQMLKLANTDIGRLIVAFTAANVALAIFNKHLGVEGILKFIGSSKVLSQTILNTTAAFQIAKTESNIFSASIVASTQAVSTLTKALLANPLFWVAAAGLAIYGIIEAVNTLTPKMETLTQKTEESTQAYDEAKSKTKEVSTELESINGKIDSLQKKGKLDITDQQELNRLQQEKKGLEDNLKIYQKIEETKKKIAATDIEKEIQTESSNPFDFLKLSDVEKDLNEAKKIFKKTGNDIADSFGYTGENIRLETSSMANAYEELGKEIEKERSKIAEGGEVSDKELENLKHMEEVYDSLGGHLGDNYTKLKEWYDQLKDGGEETEETREHVESLMSMIESSLGITREATEKTSETSQAQTEMQENLTYTEEQLKSINEEIDGMQSAYGTLTSAIDEYNSSDGITMDTLQNLLSLNGDYLSSLELVDGKLQINAQAQEEHSRKLQEDTMALIGNAAMNDLVAISTESAGSAASKASSNINQAGVSAQKAGQYASQGAQGFLELAAAMRESGMIGDVDQGKVDAWANKWAGITQNITSLQKTGSGGSPSGSRFTGKSSSPKKSRGSKKGSGGSKKGSGSSKEEYKAEVDTLYWYKNALDNAKDSVDRLNDALKNTDNFNEQEKYIRRLIDATNEQINKTNDLKNAQVGQINDYINQLRAQGFAINYSAQNNELYINNMQHLSDFTGDSAKNIEKLIKKIQDLNDDNRSLDGSVRDLTSDVKDYYDQLAEFPEKKLEKFNDLMKDFQQSRLDQVQNQIDDLKHELENDPRLKQLEKQIEALENQNDELDKQTELEEKLLAVEEAKEKLMNLNKERTIQVFRERKTDGYGKLTLRA